jgi:hypothetical protein
VRTEIRNGYIITIGCEHDAFDCGECSDSRSLFRAGRGLARRAYRAARSKLGTANHHSGTEVGVTRPSPRVNMGINA